MARRDSTTAIYFDWVKKGWVVDYRIGVEFLVVGSLRVEKFEIRRKEQ